MREISTWRLLTGPPPERDRVFYHNLWFRGHNNPRYAALLPRLERVDAALVYCSDRRLPRALQFYALRMTRDLRYRVLLGAASRRYGGLFTTDPEQVPHFSGRAVVDIDDPVFTAREAELLSHPRVAAYVVTASRAAQRFEDMGVRKPHEVIPHGVELSRVSPEDVKAVRERFRSPGDQVVGYLAAWLLTERDGGDVLYQVDHLLQVWEAIRLRLPAARLWLIGGPSRRLRKRLRGRTDVVLFGRLPRERVLAYVKNFDVALYPRPLDRGIQAAKVAEYIGLGIPTVSYDVKVTEILRETGAGLLVRSPAEFSEAVARLLSDRELHGQVHRKALAAGAALDWDRLAERYQREILARYLSP